MNKTALITGGSRGIGLGIALELARHKYDIVVLDLIDASNAKAEIEKLGVKCLTYKIDISKAEERKSTVQKLRADLPRLDILVNNAGIAPKVRADILEASEESFDLLMSVNLKGPYFLTQLIAKWMVEVKKTASDYNPVVINMSSLSAYTSSTGRGEYCVSKAGVSMMTALYADRLAEFNIPVFEIRPGIIATDMTAGVKEKYDKLIGEGILPLKRWGLPADIAKTVAGIAEGYVPYSTGQIFNVDGGFHLRRL